MLAICVARATGTRSRPPRLLQDDTTLAQSCDVVPGVAQSLEDLLGLLAEFRRGPQGTGRLAQLYRQSRHAVPIQGHDVLVREDLRVIDQLGIGLHWATGNPLRFEDAKPFVPRARGEALIKDGNELSRTLVAALGI